MIKSCKQKNSQQQPYKLDICEISRNLQGLQNVFLIARHRLKHKKNNAEQSLNKVSMTQ